MSKIVIDDGMVYRAMEVAYQDALNTHQSNCAPATFAEYSASNDLEIKAAIDAGKVLVRKMLVAAHQLEDGDGSVPSSH